MFFNGPPKFSTGAAPMGSSVEIILRGIPHSSELERIIGEESRALDRICDGVLTCRVIVEALRRPKQQGVQLAVGLAITLPGAEVVVNREHGVDASVAVRDAFNAAALQLEDYARRQAEPEHGPRNASRAGKRGH
jgi:hypothetical protein